MYVLSPLSTINIPFVHSRGSILSNNECTPQGFWDLAIHLFGFFALVFAYDVHKTHKHEKLWSLAIKSSKFLVTRTTHGMHGTMVVGRDIVVLGIHQIESMGS